MGTDAGVRTSSRVRVWLLVGAILVVSWGAAQELGPWSSAPSASGLIEVWTDAPAVDEVVDDPVGTLAGAALQYEVQVGGVQLPDPEARALLVSLLDTLQFMHLRNQLSGLGRTVAEHVPYTRTRSDRDPWVAYYPFTVAREDGAESNQSRALLDEAPGKAPGLDNARVRRTLWRDVILDLALLGSLRETLGSQAIAWLQVSDDPFTGTSAQAARAFAILQETSGVAEFAVAVPERLSDVVTLAQRAGVPQATLQRAIDASFVEGLYAGAYDGAGGVRQGSPFDELLDQAEAFGLALDIVSLVTQVGADVFDGIAMQLSANAAADVRLRFLEDLLAEDCATGSARVDAALCEGLELAREEFDALSEAVLTGMVNAIAQAVSDPDSLLTYAGLTASIVGHVASLHAAGAIATGASVAGAGVLVLKSLASIAGEYQLVRRAFLLAHLNQLLFERSSDVGLFDPAEVEDVGVWARSREHTTLALVIEWSYFHTLHQGYTASALTPTGLLHWLTQWMHGSGDVVDDLAERETAALQGLTRHQPVTSLISLQPASPSTLSRRTESRSASRGSATGGGLEGRLLFSAGAPRSTDSDLYTVNEDGTDVRLLLDTPGWIQAAYWSRDRSRVLYTDNLGAQDRDHRLAVIGSDGAVISDERLVRVIGPSCCHGGSYVLGWHPDEDSFLYKKEESSCTGNLLWRRFLDGSEEVFLDPAVVSDGVVAFIAFSPDGNEVTWVSQDGCWSPSSAMYRAPMVNGRVDTRSIELVYRDGQVLWWLAYAGDGTLAFQNTDTVPYDYPKNLYLEDAGTITRITDFFTADAWVDTFAWSPDGTRIAYSETSNASSRSGSADIVIINRDGTGRVPVVTTPNAWERVWGW